MDKKKFFNEELPALKPVQIIEHEYTQNRFVDIFTKVHGQDGDVIYEREKFYFAKALQEDPKIAECTPLSLFSVFLDIATKGLSLDRSSKALAYITFRNIKVRTPDGDQWQKRALLDISGYGELVLRIRAGQVKYADNPEVLYQDELHNFRQVNTTQGVQVEHTISYPRPTKSGIAMIYVRIVRSDGSVTFGTLDAPGIERLKQYSASNNGKWQKDEKGNYVNVPGKPNALYDDLGFLKAKCLKHAFQSFPKLKLPNFSALTNEEETPEQLGIPEQLFDSLPEKTDQGYFIPSGGIIDTDDLEKMAKETHVIEQEQEYREKIEQQGGVIIPDENNIF